MGESTSETEIVRGLRAGDRRAWDALCNQFEERLWKHIAHLVGNNPSAVADVFQETMLAAARSGRRIDVDTRIWPWLSTIAHNLSALHWRQAYRERSHLDTAGLTEGLADGMPDAQASLVRQENVEAIRSILHQMDANRVALLIAKYVDGHSVAEIVKQQGGTSESVRSSLARAKRDFRERYERVATKCD